MPSLDKASLIRLRWPAEFESVTLNANGWLHGVIVENDFGRPGYMSGRFEITDRKRETAYGVFNWEYAMHSAGILFESPLPNMNSAEPYLLHRLPRGDDEGPVLPVIVSLIGTW